MHFPSPNQQHRSIETEQKSAA